MADASETTGTPEVASVDVMNMTPRPVAVGFQMLAHREVAHAEDTVEVRALIDAGVLAEVPKPKSKTPAKETT